MTKFVKIQSCYRGNTEDELINIDDISRICLGPNILFLGKQVLEIVLDLLKDDSKIGVVLPLNINDREFTITVEKEVTDRD